MRLPASKPQNLSKTQAKYLKNNLERHGFKSYWRYLKSALWKDVKERYRSNKHLLQTCYVCRGPNVDLHHKTYKRLGDEELGDLFPLCRVHHDEIHEAGLDLWDGAKIIRKRDLERRSRILDEREGERRGIKKSDRQARRPESGLPVAVVEALI